MFRYNTGPDYQAEWMRIKELCEEWARVGFEAGEEHERSRLGTLLRAGQRELPNYHLLGKAPEHSLYRIPLHREPPTKVPPVGSPFDFPPLSLQFADFEPRRVACDFPGIKVYWYTWERVR